MSANPEAGPGATASPLAPLVRDIERIIAAGRTDSCPHHPEVEQLQREIAQLRETVAYLRAHVH